MSRPMVQHIFDDLDRDGKGTISYDELDFLAPYMGERRWSPARKATLMAEMDINKDNEISSEEFYAWAVYNCQYDREVLGSRILKQRAERLKLANTIPNEHLALLDELGTGSVAQKVTHPVSSVPDAPPIHHCQRSAISDQPKVLARWAVHLASASIR